MLLKSDASTGCTSTTVLASQERGAERVCCSRAKRAVLQMEQSELAVREKS